MNRFFCIVCALTVATFTNGCASLSNTRSANKLSAQEATQDATQVPEKAARIRVLQDEAYLKKIGGKSHVVISGTVVNTSPEEIADLLLSFELKNAKSDQTETRQVKVIPALLAPGAEGRYEFTLPAGDWSGVRISKVFNQNTNQDLAFATAQGKPRPANPQPEPTRTIVIERRAPRPSGEEFINTPETAITIR